MGALLARRRSVQWAAPPTRRSGFSARKHRQATGNGLAGHQGSIRWAEITFCSRQRAHALKHKHTNIRTLLCGRSYKRPKHVTWASQGAKEVTLKSPFLTQQPPQFVFVGRSYSPKRWKHQLKSHLKHLFDFFSEKFCEKSQNCHRFLTCGICLFAAQLSLALCITITNMIAIIIKHQKQKLAQHFKAEIQQTIFKLIWLQDGEFYATLNLWL